MLSFLTDPLASLFYPQFCGACGAIVDRFFDGAACADCWAASKIFGETDRLCSKCGLFLVELPVEDDAHDCGGCTDHLYDAARSAGLYHKALAASVLHMKRVPRVPGRVRKYLIDALDGLRPAGDFLIVPVPLSKKRLHERGFNQASLLAAAAAKYSGRPIDERTLVRARDTPAHRAAMDQKAREATVKNAFTVVRPKLIEGRGVLLVDDLMTSGATVSQCAKALKKSGAARVDVLTLARAG
ncbi:MAG: ComF family protein [Acidobacteria bacterium]|nr:ComF family protein [Acidobacteriota bacterium]